MCNRARSLNDPHSIIERFNSECLTERPMDNQFNPAELCPKSRAWMVREQNGVCGVDVMEWDVTVGAALWPMTNVRELSRPSWTALAANPADRCLIALVDFAEWTPDKHQAGEGKPIKGEMWFAVSDQPLFAVAGFWRQIGDARYFAMVTCDANELIAPVYPTAMDQYPAARGS